MRSDQMIPLRRGAFTAALLALLAVLILAGTAFATTPRTGTYRVTTTQCGTATAAHPCYSFTIKIAKGRCLPLGGRAKKPGYCVSFSYKDNGALVFADVTCPDSTSFKSQINGPVVPLLVPASGTLRFSAHAAVSEGGKEIVVGVEKLTLTVRGAHVSGTLSELTQENIGLEPPACTSGTVSFTAKRI